MSEKLASKIRDELLEGSDEEFDYHGEIASVNAVAEGRSHVKIGHFVVKKDERRKGYGTTVFETLLDVLRENGFTTATVEIQSVDDGGANDPVMDFLRNYNFEYVQDFNHHNWGNCIRARGTI